jgi:hypothetical protein
MMRLVVWARAILAGWATLLVIAFAVEWPLLDWTAPVFGSMWIATASLGFDCAALFASGWVTGRLNRSHAVRAGLLFAATLCFWDFGGSLNLNVPGLVRLVGNSFHDSRYFDSLLTSAETHLILFGCLIGGAALSRAREKALSVVDTV